MRKQTKKLNLWSLFDSAYVKICIDGVTTQTTKMKKNGSHLTWNQDFTFHLRRLKHADVRRNYNRPMVKLELYRARFELESILFKSNLEVLTKYNQFQHLFVDRKPITNRLLGTISTMGH